MGGPACGIAVCEAIRMGAVSENGFEVLVLGVVGAIGLAVGIYAIRHARAKAKHPGA